MNRMISPLSAIMFSIFCALPQVAGAQDENVEESGVDGLNVQVITQWVGGGDGGYLPIRIRLVNTGEPRVLTFRLEPATKKEKLPIVRKTIRAERNASLPITLRVPLVGGGTAAVLKVLDENGDEIESLFRRIDLPPRDTYNTYSPAVLVVSDVPVNATQLERAVHSLAVQNLGHPAHHFAHHPGQNRGMRHGNVSPALLPESWIDFTALDIVVIDLDELQRLSTSRRTAILQWVECGGTLIVRNVGEQAPKSVRLNRALQLKDNATSTDDPAGASEWKPAELPEREAARSVNIAALTQRTIIRGAGQLRPPVTPRDIDIRNQVFERFSWPRRGDAFYKRQEKLGTVVAFRNDPFTGTTRDWLWVLKSLKPAHYQWPARHGMSARRDTGEFLNFLIPGVKGVPVYAFLFLMTVFTLIIGPLNYLLLWKRKQLFLLVLTIPLVAFVTSLSLFGYSAVSHGFAVKSRVRSLTVLDQREQNAVTVSRIALFAGLAPSGGLEFPADTAVYPVWPHSNEFETGVVDWSESQVLQSGWLRSRTRTQFLTTRHHKERGRLEVHLDDDAKKTVANGFESDIVSLLITDRDGDVYFVNQLAAGQSAEVKPAAGREIRAFGRQITEQKPIPPDNVSEYRDSSIFSIRRRVYRHRFSFGRQNTNVAFAGSLMEQQFAQIVDIGNGKYTLPPNSYVAILSSNPRVDLGLDNAEAVDGFHLLVGKY